MASSNVANGINLDALNELMNAVKADPKIGRAVFSSRTTWKTGFQTNAKIGDYVQGGQTVPRGRSFQIAGDHPEGHLGQNVAPTAVETLLAATEACITGGWAIFGAAMGIHVDSLEVSLEGDIDLQGFMGLDEAVTPGFQRIHGTIRVKSPASDAQLKELQAMAEARSPVVNTLGVRVTTKLVRV